MSTIVRLPETRKLSEGDLLGQRVAAPLPVDEPSLARLDKILTTLTETERELLLRVELQRNRDADIQTHR
jgi:hypothetical protein